MNSLLSRTGGRAACEFRVPSRFESQIGHSTWLLIYKLGHWSKMDLFTKIHKQAAKTFKTFKILVFNIIFHGYFLNMNVFQHIKEQRIYLRRRLLILIFISAFCKFDKNKEKKWVKDAIRIKVLFSFWVCGQSNTS